MVFTLALRSPLTVLGLGGLDGECSVSYSQVPSTFRGMRRNRACRGTQYRFHTTVQELVGAGPAQHLGFVETPQRECRPTCQFLNFF
jgi:hypothetical protein